MTRPEESRSQAIVWMLIGMFGFSWMGVFSKQLNLQGIGPYQSAFLRSFLALPIVIMWCVRDRAEFFPNVWRSLVFRGLAGATGLLCYFYSLSVLPVAIATLLLQSSSIFVILGSMVLLKERFPPFGGFALALVVVGLWLVLIGPHEDSLKLLLSTNTHAEWGIVAGGASALLSGSAYLTIRRLGKRVPGSLVIAYLLVFGVMTSFVPAVRLWHPLRLWDWVTVLGVSASGLLGQWGLTQSYRSARAGFVSALGVTQVVFSAIWGLLLFHEDFSLHIVLGISAVISGIFMLEIFYRADTSAA